LPLFCLLLDILKIRYTQRILAEDENSAGVQRKFVLSWNHYQILTHVDNPEARNFYEIEAFKQQWSTRYLQRQIQQVTTGVCPC